MAGRVQDFITIRIGSIWIDVPMGPLQTNNSAGSLRTTAASPVVVTHKPEVNSKHEEGFTPVLSKSAKRRAGAAVKATACKELSMCVRPRPHAQLFPASLGRQATGRQVIRWGQALTVQRWESGLFASHMQPQQSRHHQVSKKTIPSTSRAARATSSPILTKTLGKALLNLP